VTSLVKLGRAVSRQPHSPESIRTIAMDVVTDSLDPLENIWADDGQIHGLVYCPGSIVLKPLNRLSEEEFLSDFRINVLGAVRVIQKCLPALKKAKGSSVVLFSTVAVQLGLPFHASVATAKAGVEALTRSLAAEYASSQIRFNAVAPSLTDTSLASFLLDTPEKKEASAKRHPLGRIGTTADMAQAVEFLMNNTWITGQVIGVDGGLSKLKI
jgi:3-oxoacyl-[acyl-carrier protein] reductase